MKRQAYKRLLQELDRKRFVTRTRVQEIYGSRFSDSTWKRLKKDLRENDNCALRWDRKTGGFAVPATWTAYPLPDPGKRDELAVLRAAAARVGPPLTDRINAFLAELDQQLAKIDPDAQAKAPLRQPAPRANREFFDLINRIDQAVRSRTIITIRYRKTDRARAEERSIAPYELHNHSGRFYVWGTDEGGTKPKFFALDRIEGLEVDFGDRFDRDPELNLDEHLRHSFGVWAGPCAAQDIEVEIDAARATDVAARRWPAEKSLEMLPNGRLRITFSVNDQREVVAWVLGFGGDAWIRQPASAARLAWQLGEKIAERHTWARSVPIDERVLRFEWGADGLPASLRVPR